MSSRINSFASTKQTEQKPYCSACHKAGKPIEEYTNHWARSSPRPDSVVTCPLILSSECGFCHNLGHWTKFCPLIASKKAIEEKNNKPEYKPVPVKKQINKITNRFDLLVSSDDDDSSDESDKDNKKTIKRVELSSIMMNKQVAKQPIVPIMKRVDFSSILTTNHFPSLPGQNKIYNKPSAELRDWVSIIKTVKPATTVLVKPVPVVTAAPTTPTPDTPIKWTPFKVWSGSWADAVSSDDEDDDAVHHTPIAFKKNIVLPFKPMKSDRVDNNISEYEVDNFDDNPF